MDREIPSTRLRPKLMSFDVFGTLISVRDSSYSAFERILADAGARHLDVKAFWEHWEHRNIAHYWDSIPLVSGDLRTLALPRPCPF